MSTWGEARGGDEEAAGMSRVTYKVVSQGFRLKTSAKP